MYSYPNPPSHQSNQRLFVLLHFKLRSRHFLYTRQKKATLNQLVWYPQFAYLPGRGTWEAITRVQAHLRAMQQLTDRWKCEASKIRSPADKKPALYGGCQLFLTFRRLRRYAQGISTTSFLPGWTPGELTQVLMHWHTQTSYIAQWKGLAGEQPTFKGVRQGPFLWASFIALALELVAQETTAHWMRHHCTVAQTMVMLACCVFMIFMHFNKVFSALGNLFLYWKGWA